MGVAIVMEAEGSSVVAEASSSWVDANVQPCVLPGCAVDVSELTCALLAVYC